MKSTIFLSMLLVFVNYSYANANLNNQHETPSSLSNPSQYIADSKITLEIKSKFLADKDIKSTDISVETNNGVVRLTGYVDSPYQKKQAEDLAKSVNGVKIIENKLKMMNTNNR